MRTPFRLVSGHLGLVAGIAISVCGPTTANATAAGWSVAVYNPVTAGYGVPSVQYTIMTYVSAPEVAIYWRIGHEATASGVPTPIVASALTQFQELWLSSLEVRLNPSPGQRCVISNHLFYVFNISPYVIGPYSDCTTVPSSGQLCPPDCQ
jgi:hypothetical protein